MNKLQALTLVVSACALGGLAMPAACGGGTSNDSDENSGGSGSGGRGGTSGKGGSSGTGGSNGGGGTSGRGGASGTGGSGASGGAGTGGSGGSGGTAGMSAAPDGGVPDAAAANCEGVPALKLTRVAAAAVPMGVLQPPGDPRIYILERGGTIRFLRNGQLVSSAFLTMTPRPPTDGERGLLGFAFHPQYMQNGRFFIYYTRAGNDPNSQGGTGDLVIAEARRSADPDKAETTYKALVTIPHSRRDNHNGGALAFGPDGLLYAGIGDGGGGGDPDKAGQDLMTKAAKILRIDVDNVNARPAGNFPPPADLHIFATGLRNPWRISFDRASGDLYIGDVGQGAWEEVSVIRKGATGANLGWSTREGKHCYGAANCNTMGLQDPVAEYVNPPSMNGQDPGASIVGGYVYRGSAIPCLIGRYIYGDHNMNKIFSFVLGANGAETSPRELTTDLSAEGTRIQGLTSFGEDANGELYLTDLFGNVYRIDRE